MKTYVMVYESFANFEVVLTSYLMKTQSEIITVALTKEPVTSAEGFKILPDMSVDEVDAKDIDLLIIPGGNPAELENATGLFDLIAQANENEAALGGICAGVIALAKAGVLKGKKYTTSVNPEDYEAFEGADYIDETLTVADYIVTAKANGYVDFALTIGEMMDIYEDDDDYEETVEFFKFFNA